jgi:hypothetical protein
MDFFLRGTQDWQPIQKLRLVGIREENPMPANQTGAHSLFDIFADAGPYSPH